MSGGLFGGISQELCTFALFSRISLPHPRPRRDALANVPVSRESEKAFDHIQVMLAIVK